MVMKRKSLTAAAFLLSLIVVALAATLIFTACNNGEKTSWTIAADGGEIKAYFSDNGRYGYVLNLEGEGAIPDYSSEKDAPWYYRSGRITDIKISEGITAVGANAFKDCKAKSVVIPKTAKSVGENSFHTDTLVCAYENITAPQSVKVYLYSETPATSDYWHFKGDAASLWTTTKVLFIGNSFTYYSDVPKLFEQIATSAGDGVIVDSVTQGAWNLTKFADPNDEHGKRVDEKLKASNDYDAVILQEQSTRPLTNYNEFLKAAKSLQSKIKSTQKNCRVYLYSTWGYKEEAEQRKITIPEMEAQIRTAYENAASTMGVSVSYVGKAFSAVYTDNKEINLYFEDDKHQSYAGAFLSACVHVATILDTDPRLAAFTGELDEATAKVLKEAAFKAAH